MILWPSERLLKSLKVIYHISFLSDIFIVCLIVLKQVDWDYISNMFIGYFIWDIIQFIATYCYIFIKYKEHKELVKRFKVHSNNRDQFKLLTPTFIIVTYISFCIPDFVVGFFQVGSVNVNELNIRIIAIAYRISWLADPIIIMYNCKLLNKRRIYPCSKNWAVSNNKTSHFW